MNSFAPPRLVIRGIAVLGGLLALAAVGLAADRRGGPVSPPLPAASAAASAAAAAAASAAAPAAAPAAAAASAAGKSMEAPSSPGILPDGRVVLNAASEEDLRKLPGVGPSRAKAILALRERRGKFRSLSELLRVKGIGRKALARLAPKLVLDAPP